MAKYLYVFLTILFTTYGQMVMKWRLSKHPFPNGLLVKFVYLTKAIFTDFYITSAFLAAFLASLFWMSALKKLQLNVAYPFMSLSFVAVFIASSFVFHEKPNLFQIIGMMLIIAGVIFIGTSAGEAA